MFEENLERRLEVALEQKEEIEPGDMNIVKEMAIRMTDDLKRLIRAAEAGNISIARATLADLNGELKQAFVNINRLAQEQGLVEPEHRNDT